MEYPKAANCFYRFVNKVIFSHFFYSRMNIIY